MMPRRPAKKAKKSAKSSTVSKSVKKKAKPKKIAKPTKSIKPKSSKDANFFQPLEQISIPCSNCGREFMIINLKGLSTEGMLCQRCQFGEIEFPE